MSARNEVALQPTGALRFNCAGALEQEFVTVDGPRWIPVRHEDHDWGAPGEDAPAPSFRVCKACKQLTGS